MQGIGELLELSILTYMRCCENSTLRIPDNSVLPYTELSRLLLFSLGVLGSYVHRLGHIHIRS